MLENIKRVKLSPLKLRYEDDEDNNLFEKTPEAILKKQKFLP